MKSGILQENIESFEKVIKNLKDYMIEQEDLIEKIKTNVTDIEEEVHWLEELRDEHVKLLKEKE